MRFSLSAAGFAALAALLAGCNFAPDYNRPETVTPESFKEANGQEWRSAQPADALTRGKWWSIFGDADLDALEAKVTDANQDLKAAVARYDQARAVSAIARSQYYPTVTANGVPTRQQMSKTIANPRPTSLYNDYLVNLDFSYEVDLWGRVRNMVANAEATEQATAGDLASLDLSTHAELASDYYTLRGDDAQQAVLDRTVDAYQKAYDLTVNRHNGGAVAESDVDQAETQLESAKTQAADVRLRRAQLEHAIAILIGVPPAQFSIPAKPLTKVSPPLVNPGLPSSLLERRPDVAAAERRANAANANIGVARAAFFPQLNLNLIGGFESAGASQLFNTASRIWTLGATASAPLFDGGQRNAVTDQAIAQFDEAAANYRQSVLDAFRDVEDNLSALHQLQSEGDSQARAVDAAERAVHQAQLRYTGGLVTYLEVVTTQSTALQNELSAADIAARRMTASVALIKALGGGWQTGDLPPATSQGLSLNP
jgi:NodT family efflux transporter outer membrane factor (OMF) lipoprotein